MRFQHELQRLIGEVPAALFMLQPTGDPASPFRAIYINPGVTRMTGYTLAEWSVRKSFWIEHIHPDDRASALERMAQLKTSGNLDHQFRFIHKNGDFRWLHESLTVLSGEGDDDWTIVGCWIDVTQQKKSEEQLLFALQGAALGYWDWHIDTGRHLVNDRWLDILGLTRSDIANHESDWSNRIHPDDRKRIEPVIFTALESGETYVVEFRMRHQQGHWVWIQGSGAVVERDAQSGEPKRLCGTHQDISDRKRQEGQINKMSRALWHSPSAILIMDIDGVIEYINPKYTELTGRTSADVVGQKHPLFKAAERDMKLRSDFWNKIGAGNEWQDRYSDAQKNGEIVWIDEMIAPVYDDTGATTHFVAIQQDITEQHRLTEHLLHQSQHDTLTGLINRREFEQRLKRSIDSAIKARSHHALCFLDLDQFKVVNDSCGHAAGDELLRQIAILLRSRIRHRDSFARLGGDEFAILLEHTSAEEAFPLAETLRGIVEDFIFIWGDRRFTIGVSMGLVNITSETTDADELLRDADAACYLAKEAGRNRIHLLLPSDDQLLNQRNRLEWVTRITDALKTDRFYLSQQTIAPLGASPGKRHIELLLRLKDSDGKAITPDRFLPVAERYNLIGRVDRWVVQRALEWLAEHDDVLAKLDMCAINLSGKSLGDSLMLAFIEEQIARTGVPADILCFEITETAAINNLSLASAFIAKLRAYGCRFALDDFGSGLSSFAYLKTLDVDFLKIDGSFIRDMLNDPTDFAMVKAINEIGHILGKQTIAECVETDEAIASLRDLGIDFIQGFAIGAPQPLTDLSLSLARSDAAKIKQRRVVSGSPGYSRDSSNSAR